MKRDVIALLLSIAMAASMLGGCGDKNPPADAEAHSAEKPAESGASDIYRQGATELPRKDLGGKPDFIIKVDEDGNQIIVPYSEAVEEESGEVLDGTEEDRMMVDENGENAG